MTYNVLETRITSFTDLRSWQQARELSVMLYRLTMDFPISERFGLTSQMRRAGVSVAANIAEGFSRNTAKDKINFYGMALGSLTETQSHVYIAQDLEFLTEDNLLIIMEITGTLHKMINGLIKTAQGRNT